MYDRSILRSVATARGHAHYLDVSTALGVAPVTAWRLWNGKTAPSVALAAAVEQTYGIPASQLLRLDVPAPRAAVA
ncbi:XRE family transcriptional regulator [Streptomyces sp. NPDC058254]|uniref:XRE family transcriptional regulator n=1 Tax=Streptomyces sp. NPDC058254 TaxID=3346406 RepID=UPI0036E27445